MSTKHTPGSWRATTKHVYAPETEDRLGLDVQINGGNRDDNKANARLIAAAPELLEACIKMIEYCDNQNPPQGNGLWCIRLIRAAIAKATGESV
jgi:hypothetical protein